MWFPFFIIYSLFDNKVVAICARAAYSLTLDSFSTSTTALGAGLVASLVNFFYKGRMKDLRNDRRTLKSIAVGLVGACVVWVGVFINNLRLSQRVFTNPPSLIFSWSHRTKGIEFMPGMPGTISSKFLQDRDQYSVEISSKSEYDVPISTKVLFRLPYVLENFSVTKSGDVTSTFEPFIEPVRFVIYGNAKFLGNKNDKIYLLTLKDMPPHGKIRIVLLLNHNPQTRMIISGDISAPLHYPLPPPLSVGGPLDNYVIAEWNFAYGKQVAMGESYAPFQVDNNKIVSMGDFGPIPPNLSQAYEVP